MLNIIFRIDSGSIISSGHVYRCLSLTEYIRNSNIEFICKNHDKKLYSINFLDLDTDYTLDTMRIF